MDEVSVTQLETVVFWFAVALGPWLGPPVLLPLLGRIPLPPLARWLRAQKEAAMGGGNPRTAMLWGGAAALGTFIATATAGALCDPVHTGRHVLGGALAAILPGALFAWIGRYGFAGLRLPLLAFALPSAGAVAGVLLAGVLLAGVIVP